MKEKEAEISNCRNVTEEICNATAELRDIDRERVQLSQLKQEYDSFHQKIKESEERYLKLLDDISAQESRANASKINDKL